MKSQTQMTRAGALAGLAGAFLPVILLLAFGNVRGGLVDVLTAVMAVVALLGVAGALTAAITYREAARKPGSVPLVVGLGAALTGMVLVPVFLGTQIALFGFTAMYLLTCGILALIVGVSRRILAPAV